VATGFLWFVARRAVAALILVFVVSSAALILARLAPGNQFSGFGVDPRVAAAECARIRCNDPVLAQYAAWLGRTIRFDFGESSKYGRPVGSLVQERAVNSLTLGVLALIVATLIGVPAGVISGSRRRGPLAAMARAGSVVLLSCPPLVLALLLLLLASRTGWFPIGGLPGDGASLFEQLRYLTLPVIALALPTAATLERLQSRAIRDALDEPCIRAAAARGVSERRIVWRHAWKLSLASVLGIYGIIIGALISGSFVVEYLMAWPGLGSLMYEALIARDAYLSAGCAAAGAVALATGIFVSDIVLAAVDPRATSHA
jgi:ABC-type dipeptide/oligopeptide/nickel transport system permease component